MLTNLKNIHFGETAKELWKGLIASSSTYIWANVIAYEQTGQTGTPLTIGRSFSKGLNEGYVYVAFYNKPVSMSDTPTENDIDCIYEFKAKIGG